MHQIKIYAELHWTQQRPRLEFQLNDQTLITHCYLVDHADQRERVIYSSTVEQLYSQNYLDIVLNDKFGQTVSEQCDHWAEIVNVHVDQIPADWLVHANSVFRHALDPDWLAQARQHGFQIESEYRPGTQLRMNGTCSYYFESPFLQHKINGIWKK